MQICSVALFSDTFIHFCLPNESGHSLFVLYVEVSLELLKKPASIFLCYQSAQPHSIQFFMILRILPKVHRLKSCLFQTKSIHESLLNASNHPYKPLPYSLGISSPKQHQMFMIWEHGPFIQGQNCAFLISNIVIFSPITT